MFYSLLLLDVNYSEEAVWPHLYFGLLSKANILPCSPHWCSQHSKCESKHDSGHVINTNAAV